MKTGTLVEIHRIITVNLVIIKSKGFKTGTLMEIMGGVNGVCSYVNIYDLVKEKGFRGTRYI